MTRPPWVVIDEGRPVMQEGGIFRRFSVVRNTSDLYTDKMTTARGGKVEVVATFKNLSAALKFAETMDFRHHGRKGNPPKARRLDREHALLRDDQVYCMVQDDAAPPVVTHSAVKCLYCRRVLTGMHRVPGMDKNPPRSSKGPVKIYGQTEKIFMKKTAGPYKGKRFVHDFKPGVQQVGFPRGTKIIFPDGRGARLTTRSVLLTGKKDLYRNFTA